MRTTTLQFTARLSALTVSAGALAILLIASPARSVDIETIEAQQNAYLEGLMVRHDVRYALELPKEEETSGAMCDGAQSERS